MPNNIMVGSEKLFRTKAPWRIDNSFLGLLTPDHDVILFNHNPFKDTHYGLAKELSKTLYWRSQRHLEHTIFIGYEDECRICVDLSVDFGFTFDAVVLINNPHPGQMYDGIFDDTAIYNFYTKPELVKNEIEGAEVNQYIKTLLPAHMSNRLAQEVYAQIVYDNYAQNFLSPNEAIFTYI